jgi:hypothetical protein
MLSGMRFGGNMPYPPFITTFGLPNAIVNTAYSAQLSASGGFPPYTFYSSGVGLGFSLSPSGLITGTPASVGTFTANYFALDSIGVPSAPQALTVTVQNPGQNVYTIDHYASPTGSDTNTGLDKDHPWSISAIYTKTPGSWSVLGLLPGVYTGSTDVPNYFTAYQAGTLTPITIPAGTTIVSCNANGVYDGNRYAIIDWSDTGNGGNQPLGLDFPVFKLGGSGITIDAVEIRYCGSGGIAGSGTSNCQILNCEIHHLLATYEQKNSNALSWNGNVAPGALNNYVYNCYIHDNQTLTPTAGKLDPASLTSTGGNIATGGAPYAGRVGNGTNWPFSSTTIQAGVWFTFTDTGQTIGVIGSAGIAATNNSTTLTWNSQSIAATNGIGTWTITPYYPYAMWGYYSQAVAKSAGQPYVIESCTAQRQYWNGNKTDVGQVQLKRCYFETANFGALGPGEVSTSKWAFAGLNTLAGMASGADHCIFIGDSQVFNEPGTTVMNTGTATMTNNTYYIRPGIVGQGSHFTYGVDGVNFATATIHGHNNLFASAFTTPETIWISAGGTNPGTIDLDYNAFYLPQFKQTNAGSALSPGGTILTFAQIKQPPYGYETHSTDLLQASPFVTTPVAGDVSTFAITGAAATAGIGGVPCGAIDGTVGKNGIPVGCSFSKLSITTATLPNATVGSAYSTKITAQGGSREYTWTLVSVAPNWLLWLGPNGRTLTSSQFSTCDLTSINPPQNVETETIVVQVTDNRTGVTAQATLTLTVQHQ